jgi:hypothetical protein
VSRSRSPKLFCNAPGTQGVQFANLNRAEVRAKRRVMRIQELALMGALSVAVLPAAARALKLPQSRLGSAIDALLAPLRPNDNADPLGRVAPVEQWGGHPTGGTSDASKHPLLFLHIPKTGGTSLIAALMKFYHPEDIITDSGNIGLGYLRENERRLRPGTFIFGHPDHNVMNFMINRSLSITMLRCPKFQAVSNYLYLVREPGNPFHTAAVSLGFSEFFKTNWQFIVFQTITLDVSISSQPIRFPQDIERRVGFVLDLLNTMSFVGCTETADEFCFQLSVGLGLPSLLVMPRENTAAEHHDPEEVERLHDSYDRLRRDPVIAHLMAIEEAVYSKAVSLRSKCQQRIVENAFARARLFPNSPFLAYIGENGIVFLAGNWRPPERSDAGPLWWTGGDDISTFVIKLNNPAVRSLSVDLSIIHFVSGFAFEANGHRLEHKIETETAGGRRTITIDLLPLIERNEARAIITLRIARQMGPDVPPFYPAMALCGFELR